jgi:hypothetical protein
MKKKQYIIITMILISSIFSCIKDENLISGTENKDLTSNILLKKSTNKVTPLINRLGVTEIEVSNENVTKYKVKALKHFYFDGKKRNISNYKFIIKDEYLYCDKFPDFKITTTLDKRVFVQSKKFNGYSTEYKDISKSFEYTILMIFLNELFSSDDNKTTLKLNKAIEPCSFWDTYYIINNGGSRSVAQSAADAEVRLTNLYIELSGSSCSMLGGTDVSCLWENHACIATTAYCCPDGAPY